MPRDIIDQRLLAALKKNARAPVSELARLVGRSRTTVQGRIERLEREGVILGYSVKLRPDHEHGAVRGHVMIKLELKKETAVLAALKKIDEVHLVLSVSGVFDMVVIASAETVGDIETTIDRIAGLDGVDRTTSSIILSTKLDR